MNRWTRARAFVALIMILTLSLPLAALAQSDKQEEKKEDKKEEGLPLKATEKIKFTTDEGTWMSLDVSADGRTIVFDLLGDIYKVAVAGGEARRIIGGISSRSFRPTARRLFT